MEPQWRDLELNSAFQSSNELQHIIIFYSIPVIFDTILISPQRKIILLNRIDVRTNIEGDIYYPQHQCFLELMAQIGGLEPTPRHIRLIIQNRHI